MKKKNLNLGKLALKKEKVAQLDGVKITGGATAATCQVTCWGNQTCKPHCLPQITDGTECQHTGASGCQPCQSAQCPSLRCG